MRVLVILNAAAGTLAASQGGGEAERIAKGFADAGVEAVVRSVPGAKLAETAAGAGAEGFDTVVAGGGDGTLNTIANALLGGPVAFGVLPLGTHNHFAKELKVPLDLDQAVAALARGTVADLDVGTVNDRVFLNFSGLGLHPMVVKHRDAQRDLLGRRKFVAMFFAFFRSLRHLPVRRVRLRVGDRTISRVTPSVTVCNNVLQMEVFGIAHVSHPERNALNVFLARAKSPLGIVWLIFRAATGTLATAKGFEAILLPEFDLETRRRHARVSIDGEVTDLPTPLRYRVKHGGLKIIRPEQMQNPE